MRRRRRVRPRRPNERPHVRGETRPLHSRRRPTSLRLDTPWPARTTHARRPSPRRRGHRRLHCRRRELLPDHGRHVRHTQLRLEPHTPRPRPADTLAAGRPGRTPHRRRQLRISAAAHRRATSARAPNPPANSGAPPARELSGTCRRRCEGKRPARGECASLHEADQTPNEHTPHAPACEKR